MDNVDYPLLMCQLFSLERCSTSITGQGTNGDASRQVPILDTDFKSTDQPLICSLRVPIRLSQLFPHLRNYNAHLQPPPPPTDRSHLITRRCQPQHIRADVFLSTAKSEPHTQIPKNGLSTPSYRDRCHEDAHERLREFFVRFKGPAETPFEGGVWKVHVELPDQYPYKSPSIGFVNRIFHPNIDELSGSVCLDVINQTWSPMYDMINIFEVFLPQLLRYPNPSDPLNGEAAALLLRDPKNYEIKVKDYVQRYATKGAADEAGAESEDDDDLSSVGSYNDDDEEEAQPAGEMDDV